MSYTEIPTDAIIRVVNLNAWLNKQERRETWLYRLLLLTVFLTTLSATYAGGISAGWNYVCGMILIYPWAKCEIPARRAWKPKVHKLPEFNG